MEFLLGSDDDDDNNEVSQKDISIVPVKNKWTELSDDDDEEVIDNTGCQFSNDEFTSILPRAEDLFSSVSAQFININTTNENHIASFVSDLMKIIYFRNEKTSDSDLTDSI